MRIYMGFRAGGLCYVYHWDACNPQRPERLEMRMDLWNHSPAGFNWGYGGSGPAQLALALAADALVDDQRASRIHQPLKWALVAKFPRDCWSVTRDQVCELVVKLEAANDEKWEAAHDQS